VRPLFALSIGLLGAVSLHAWRGHAAPAAPLPLKTAPLKTAPLKTAPSKTAPLTAAPEKTKPLNGSHQRSPAHDPKPTELRLLAVGGGATPEYTEVSLEQDIELVIKVFPAPALSLFAGGSESDSVRTLDPKANSDALLSQLGELFDPRSGRDSNYRRTSLVAQPASLENFESSFVKALASGQEPLFVYIASHGLQGEHPRDNHVELWGGEPLTVSLLDELEGESTRPLRLVITSCYSGGFADLAFAHAEPSAGPTRAPRCGLFAGTWDRQTSGCDPNPDRRRQESYSIHLLHALRGEDRDGKRLPPDELDLDGDGKISLLEAHTRARIASHSIDVPTTTSERYLREVEHLAAKPGKPNPKLLPEEAAVIARLGARLKLTTQAAAQKHYDSLSAKLDALDAELDRSDAELERAQGHLKAALLARWAVLSDPYHPEFAPTLSQHADAIRQALTESPLARAYQAAHSRSDELIERANALDPDEAVALRLVRAYETLALATSLSARGGPAYAHYKDLLTCERSVP
jgi:hypothetical protein